MTSCEEHGGMCVGYGHENRFDIGHPDPSNHPLDPLFESPCTLCPCQNFEEADDE